MFNDFDDIQIIGLVILFGGSVGILMISFGSFVLDLLNRSIYGSMITPVFVGVLAVWVILGMAIGISSFVSEASGPPEHISE